MLHVVGISEMKVSGMSDDVLVTYSLGSCVGLSLFDPVEKVGGLIHCMMPTAIANPSKAEASPFMFVDTGLIKLLQALFDRGAQRKRLVAKLAGGSSMLDPNGRFRIGERNYAVARKILWKNSILIDGEAVGGTATRTMTLYMQSGRTTIRFGRKERDV